MTFELIDAAKKDSPVQRLCKVLGVSPSGTFAWKARLASRRQRDDLEMLAHVRSAFTLSYETGACPGLDLGEARAWSTNCEPTAFRSVAVALPG